MQAIPARAIHELFPLSDRQRVPDPPQGRSRYRRVDLDTVGQPLLFGRQFSEYALREISRLYRGALLSGRRTEADDKVIVCHFRGAILVITEILIFTHRLLFVGRSPV